jgi:hypothetical protein
VDQQLEGDGPHLLGRWVLFVIRAELVVEPKVGLSKSVVAPICGPHAGKDLGHGAKVLLHCPLALVNQPTAGGKVCTFRSALFVVSDPQLPWCGQGELG